MAAATMIICLKGEKRFCLLISARAFILDAISACTRMNESGSDKYEEK